MKPTPWKCGSCRERAVVPAVIPSYSATLHHDGRRYPVVIADLAVFRCSTCGTIVLDDAANRRITEILRSAAGLLAPDEIRRGREVMGLDHATLGDRTLASGAAVARWETGGQLQSRDQDRALRRLFDVAEVL